MKINVDEKIIRLIEENICCIPICIDEPKVKDSFKYLKIASKFYNANLILNINEKSDLVLSYLKTRPYRNYNILTGLKIDDINTVTLSYKLEDGSDLVITDKFIKTILLSNVIILLGKCSVNAMLTLDKLDLLFLMVDNDKKVDIMNTLLADMSIDLDKIKFEEVSVKRYKENKVMNRIDSLILNVKLVYKVREIELDMEWNLDEEDYLKYLSIDGIRINKDNIAELLLDKILNKESI